MDEAGDMKPVNSGFGWIGPPPKEKDVDRHCAYCLTLIPAAKVKLCAKCHRRAYCSRECQANDWRSKHVADRGGKGVGQGHKDWCGLPAGEEDLDWEVGQVEGRGQGLIAKRFIPTNSRILVEGFNGNGAVDNFTDMRDAIREMFRCNIPNHDCDANSGKFMDLDFKVMGIYAKRNIIPGEEICVTYTALNESYDVMANHYKRGAKNLDSFADCRKLLKSQWGIVCPPDCFCRKEDIQKALVDGRKLYQKKWTKLGVERGGKKYDQIHATQDLKVISELLENITKIHGGDLSKVRILEKGFEIAIKQMETFDKAQEFATQIHDIYMAITHPKGSYGGLVDLTKDWRKKFERLNILKDLKLRLTK